MLHLKRIIVLWNLIFSLSCSLLAKPTDVVYLIPENYTGGVIVLYNQPDGIEPEKAKDGTIIYRIPQNGFLKIKSPFERKTYRFKYYLVDANNKRTEIEYLYPEGYVRGVGEENQKSHDTISEAERENTTFVMNHRNSNFNAKDGRVFLTCFSVGKPKDSEKIYTDTDRRIFKIQEEIVKINVHPTG